MLLRMHFSSGSTVGPRLPGRLSATVATPPMRAVFSRCSASRPQASRAPLARGRKLQRCRAGNYKELPLTEENVIAVLEEARSELLQVRASQSFTDIFVR